MMFLINSWLPGMLDAVFQASFLCALLLFWLCVYHGLRQVTNVVVFFFSFFHFGGRLILNISVTFETVSSKK